MTGKRQLNRDAPGPAPNFEHRPVRPPCERKPQANVIPEVTMNRVVERRVYRVRVINHASKLNIQPPTHKRPNVRPSSAHTRVISLIVERRQPVEVRDMIHLACGVLLVLGYALTPAFF